MTLTLELPPEVEGALAEEARQKGTTLERLILDDLRLRYRTQRTPPASVGKPLSPMLALFAEWDAEDATGDPEEITRRNRDWQETKANLEANRFSLEGRTDFRALLGDETESDPQGEGV